MRNLNINAEKNYIQNTIITKNNYNNSNNNLNRSMDNYQANNQSLLDRSMDWRMNGNRRALNKSIAAYNMDQVRAVQLKNQNEVKTNKAYKDSIDSLMNEQSKYIQNRKG